jgi:hypothetical protein
MLQNACGWADCWACTCRNQDWALRSEGGTAERRRDTPSAARPCSSPVSAAFFRARAPCKCGKQKPRNVNSLVLWTQRIGHT